jgi:hypothetical protein
MTRRSSLLENGRGRDEEAPSWALGERSRLHENRAGKSAGYGALVLGSVPSSGYDGVARRQPLANAMR